MPVAALIPALIGGSIASSALANRKSARTQTSTPTYTPEQTALQRQVLPSLQTRLAQPGAERLKPMKVNAIGKVNQSFDGVGDRLEQNLTARGFGKSGKLVSGQKGVEIARAGAMGNLESQFAAMALDEENRVIDDAMRFSFSNPGQNTVLPGSAAGSAISSGVESLTSLFALNQLLSGKPIW